MTGRRTFRIRDPLAVAGAAVFAVLVVAPLLFSLGYALLYSLGLTGLLASGLTGRYWMQLLWGGELWASFVWSGYLAAAATGMTLALALPLSLLLNRSIVRGPLGALLYLPLALPATAAAFLVFVALSPFGIVARLAQGAGLLGAGTGLPGIVHDRFGVGILIAHVGMAVPFFTLLFAQLFRQERLGEIGAMARSLGARAPQVLWRVTLPVLMRRAGPSVLLLFVAVLGSFEIPLLLDRQSPQMLSVLAMRKLAHFDVMQKPEAFVVALTYTGVVLIGLGALFRSGRMDV